MSLLTLLIAPSASGPDTSPPVFLAGPSVSSVTSTGATVSATINEIGNIYWVVVPQSEATPTVAQVIAGQNATGLPADDSGSVTSTTALIGVSSGLTPGVPYKFCVVAQDLIPNTQTFVTLAAFSTIGSGRSMYSTAYPNVLSITQGRYG